MSTYLCNMCMYVGGYACARSCQWRSRSDDVQKSGLFFLPVVPGEWAQVIRFSSLGLYSLWYLTGLIMAGLSWIMRPLLFVSLRRLSSFLKFGYCKFIWWTMQNSKGEIERSFCLMGNGGFSNQNPPCCVCGSPLQSLGCY